MKGEVQAIFGPPTSTSTEDNVRLRKMRRDERPLSGNNKIEACPPKHRGLLKAVFRNSVPLQDPGPLLPVQYLVLG
jgi:hypothetical protein